MPELTDSLVQYLKDLARRDIVVDLDELVDVCKGNVDDAYTLGMAAGESGIALLILNELKLIEQEDIGVHEDND